jgi:hypothetical protein
MPSCQTIFSLFLSAEIAISRLTDKKQFGRQQAPRCLQGCLAPARRFLGKGGVSRYGRSSTDLFCSGKMDWRCRTQMVQFALRLPLPFTKAVARYPNMTTFFALWTAQLRAALGDDQLEILGAGEGSTILACYSPRFPHPVLQLASLDCTLPIPYSTGSKKHRN